MLSSMHRDPPHPVPFTLFRGHAKMIPVLRTTETHEIIQREYHQAAFFAILLAFWLPSRNMMHPKLPPSHQQAG